MAEISYTKTNWVNNVTKLNADNMNHIENGIEAIDIALGTKADKSYVDNAIASSAVSPTVNTEAITGGTKVTITDKDGAHEFNVMNGTNGTNGKDGTDGTDGTDGITPTIGANGNWYLGNTDTGKPSRGANGTNGTNGKDGTTWYEGTDYPIGAKGNDLWLYTGNATHKDGFKLGDVSQYNGTGWDVIANIRGATGATGAAGKTGPAGKSAYASAQDGGFTGTEAQFNTDLATVGNKTDASFSETYSATKNFIGTKANIMYRCYIPNSAKITISTSDNTTITTPITLNLYKKDKTKADYWSLKGYSQRTITTNADIYFVAITAEHTAPLQLELGETKTAYEPYFMNARVLNDELDAITENAKIASTINRTTTLHNVENNLISGYLNAADGAVVVDSSLTSFITGYISVNNNEVYHYAGHGTTSTVAICCFYDENFSFISSVNGTSIKPTITDITIPANVKYARFASYDAVELIVYKKPSVLMYRNALTNKKWYACGDSFTQGAFGTATDKWFTEGKYKDKLKTYPYYIGNRTDCNVFNIGLSGSTLAYVASEPKEYAFSAEYAEGEELPFNNYKSVPADADFITLWFGINDIAFNVPIGEDNDVVNTTFKGAWNIVLKYYLQNCPNAHIGIIVSNNISQTNKAYIDATIAMAQRWGISYLDLNSENVPMMQATLQTASEEAKALAIERFAMSSTNMHPNYAAHEYESYFIEKWLCGA